MKKEIFYDHQFKVWVGVVLNSDDYQVRDCEYFPNKQLALQWKLVPIVWEVN